MSRLRRVLPILILLAVLALGGAIWRHLSRQSPEEILDALPQQVDLSLDQLHYTHTEDGQRRWILDAEQAQYQRESGEALLEQVQLTLFNVNRYDELKVNAAQGRLNQQTRQVEIWGDVKVSTATGEWLETERLSYSDEQRLLSTDAAVRVYSAQMELTGVGLQVEIDKGRLQVQKDVWMLLLPMERVKR